jgi:hypothetical protein
MTRARSYVLGFAAAFLGFTAALVVTLSLAGPARAALPPPNQCRPGQVCGSPQPPPPKPVACSLTEYCDRGTISCKAEKSNANVCKTSVLYTGGKGRTKKQVRVSCVSLNSRGDVIFEDSATCTVAQ